MDVLDKSGSASRCRLLIDIPLPLVFFWFPVIVDSTCFTLTIWRAQSYGKEAFKLPRVEMFIYTMSTPPTTSSYAGQLRPSSNILPSDVKYEYSQCHYGDSV